MFSLGCIIFELITGKILMEELFGKYRTISNMIEFKDRKEDVIESLKLEPKWETFLNKFVEELYQR